MSTIPQYDALQKRLRALNNQSAKYGISADPSISIEIEDLTQIIGQMNLIDIRRRNVDVLLRQRTTLGNYVPPHINTQIATERAEIARLRAWCASKGQRVPEHFVDSDQTADPPDIQSITPAPTSDLHTKLDQAIALLVEIRAALT